MKAEQEAGRDRAGRNVNGTNKTSGSLCSGAVPCSPTNTSHPGTQKSPQTGTIGCAVQASKDELAKNKSLSSEQLLPFSLAGEKQPLVAQHWEYPGDPPFPGTQPPSTSPGCSLIALQEMFPQHSLLLACFHLCLPGKTRFIILSHSHWCCSTAGPAVSSTNVPISSLHTT